MSEAAGLLAKCRERGITLRLGEDGRLKVSPPPERLPSELVEELRRYKQQLLTLLTTEAPAPRQEPSPDYRVLYAETTRSIHPDFYLIDSWLAEAHPAVWQRIRDLDDELSRMEQEGVPESIYRAKLAELLTLCRQTKDLREGRWGALLVRSTLLGREVWVVRDEIALVLVRDDERPIFFVDELEKLKDKSPDQIQDILKAKAVFPGCRVVQ